MPKRAPKHRVPEQPSEPPRGCTCLRLRKASRRVTQIYDQHLTPYGLTITQYSLLAHLKALDGIGVGQLAEKLVMDQTTLSRTLRPLQLRSLIALASDPRDRRNRNLHLTDAGRDALAKARPAWDAAQRQINHALGTAEHVHLAAALDSMLTALGET